VKFWDKREVAETRRYRSGGPDAGFSDFTALGAAAAAGLAVRRAFHPDFAPARAGMTC
jgi:hypothetical protein